MNGWKNHATWAASMWITELGFEFNHEGVDAFKAYLEEVEDSLPYFVREFLTFDEICWDELHRVCDEEYEEEEEEDE